ncbi:MAG: aminomethyl-transferring glycine dehydrogenase subunit GcvPA [Actinobacteria bacterium]|nr:aminomethyl-transferring glycine dehydrogenase subunit GcvPA [Actinomycetota bacterium]
MKKNTEPSPHPYMANSNNGNFDQMMKVADVSDIEELFEQIPIAHRTKRDFDLGPVLSAESSLYRHMTGILRKSENCEDNLNFLGAGCWQHYVPAICDEMVMRAEFLTPVWGTPSSDHGRSQAWFEFASQLGELVGMEFVGLPVYSFGTAGGHAIRMAARITKRSKVLLPRSLDPERLAVMKTYCSLPELTGYIEIVLVDMDSATGRIDLNDLKAKLSDEVAAVYFDNPSYLGVVESEALEISRLAHEYGAEVIVGVDPISLGILVPPSEYGADIVVGTTQPLGVHMNCGGGVGGFIATRDEEKYAVEYPTLQVSLTNTSVEGEMAFGLTLFEQSSYGSREQGKDWTGNSVYLWAIANAVYMSLMGPQGFRDIGNSIIERSHYAATRINSIPGLKVLWPEGFFKEFVVNFDDVAIGLDLLHSRLRDVGIFAGKDLQSDFPELGKSVLYCVTEIHTKEDIDQLVAALGEAIK